MNDPHRLARIARVKQRVRDRWRAELSKARGALEAARTHAEKADRALESAVERLLDAQSLPGHEIALRAAHVARAERSRVRAREEVARMEAAHERTRQEAMEANREVRALEMRRERVLRERRRDADRREQCELDEAAHRRGRTS